MADTRDVYWVNFKFDSSKKYKERYENNEQKPDINIQKPDINIQKPPIII